MAIEIQNGEEQFGVANILTIDPDTLGARVHPGPEPTAFHFSGITGTVAAAAGAGGTWWSIYTGGLRRTRIHQVTVQLVCIVSFTTQPSATRVLQLMAAAGPKNFVDNSSNSSAILRKPRADNRGPEPSIDIFRGGHSSFATTAGVGTFQFQAGASQLGAVLFSPGTAGTEKVLTWNDRGSPLILEPGGFLALRNPSAMDAAGTWQVTGHVVASLEP